MSCSGSSALYGVGSNSNSKREKRNFYFNISNSFLHNEGMSSPLYSQFCLHIMKGLVFKNLFPHDNGIT